MKLLQHPRAADVSECLAAVDALRAGIVSGEIVGFAAVGITPTDDTVAYTGCVGHVTRLRTMGAVSYLLACLHSGNA